MPGDLFVISATVGFCQSLNYEYSLGNTLNTSRSVIEIRISGEGKVDR